MKTVVAVIWYVLAYVLTVHVTVQRPVWIAHRTASLGASNAAPGLRMSPPRRYAAQVWSTPGIAALIQTVLEKTLVRVTYVPHPLKITDAAQPAQRGARLDAPITYLQIPAHRPGAATELMT